MKRILASLLVVLFVLPFVVACNPTDEPDVTTPGTTAPETEIIENVITVDIPYTYSIVDGKVRLLRYTGTEENVVVPAKVGEYPVEIGKMAFANNQTLKSVEIPGAIDATGELAFYNCTALTTLKLNEGTTTVSYGSFSGCTALTGVVLPNSVWKLDMAAFKGCTALDAIDLNKVTTIEDGAFNASGLKSIVIPETLQYVEEQSFMECVSLEKVEWYAKINIREEMFAYCYALKDVTITEGVPRIYDSCFRRCTGLETITFPSTVQRYYAHAMYGCTSLKSITFMNPGIDRYYEMAFHFLPALTDIYFVGTEEQWNAMDKGKNNEGLTLDTVTVHFNYGS